MKCNMKRTANIYMIFLKATDYVHPDTGKSDGHFCLVCRFVFFLKFDAFCNILPRDKGVRKVAYFFSRGTSTLWTHIARYQAFPSINCNALSNPFKEIMTTLTSIASNVQSSIYLSTIELSLP